METIGSQQIWSYLEGEDSLVATSNTKVRQGNGFFVDSYIDLAKCVAALQYRNRDFVLLSRGQREDYKNSKRSSTLQPTLFRGRGKRSKRSKVTREGFEKMRRAEELLIERYRSNSQRAVDYIKRHQIVRWSILQHYEICPTPLLDVSQSLRISASFAALNAGNEAFVYILGVPNISGAITASAEAGVEVVRLSSVCPPEAVRPHIQEGFLLSEYPELSDHAQQQNYQYFEIDFGLRLIAKFRFRPSDFFWQSKDFPPIPEAALYPPAEMDPIRAIAEEIKSQVKSEFGGV